MAGSEADRRAAALRHFDALREAWAAALLNRLETLYTLTEHGEHVWRAYRVARHYRVPLPAWVLLYLDTCAKPFATGPSSAKDVMRLLQLSGGGHRTGRATTADRDLGIVQQIVLEVKRLKRTAPDLDTFEKVGERVGLSGGRVQRIWYAWTARRP